MSAASLTEANLQRQNDRHPSLQIGTLLEEKEGGNALSIPSSNGGLNLGDTSTPAVPAAPHHHPSLPLLHFPTHTTTTQDDHPNHYYNGGGGERAAAPIVSSTNNNNTAMVDSRIRSSSSLHPATAAGGGGGGSAGDVESIVSQTPSLTRGMNKDDMRAQLRAIRLQGGRRAVIANNSVAAAPSSNASIAVEAEATTTKDHSSPLARPNFMSNLHDRSSSSLKSATGVQQHSRSVAAAAGPSADTNLSATVPGSTTQVPAIRTRARGLSLPIRRPLSVSSARRNSEEGGGEEEGGAVGGTFSIGGNDGRSISPTSVYFSGISSSRLPPTTTTATATGRRISTSSAPAPPTKSPRQITRETTRKVLEEKLHRVEMDMSDRRTRAMDAAAMGMLLVAMENTSREIKQMELPVPVENHINNVDKNMKVFEDEASRQQGRGASSNLSRPSDRDQLVRMLILEKAKRINKKSRRATSGIAVNAGRQPSSSVQHHSPTTTNTFPQSSLSSPHRLQQGGRGSSNSTITKKTINVAGGKAKSPLGKRSSSPIGGVGRSSLLSTSNGSITITPAQQDDILAMYDQLHRTSDLLSLATGLLQSQCTKSLQGLSPAEFRNMGVVSSSFAATTSLSPSSSQATSTTQNGTAATARAFLDRVSLTNSESAEALAELTSKFRSRLDQLRCSEDKGDPSVTSLVFNTCQEEKALHDVCHYGSEEDEDRSPSPLPAHSSSVNGENNASTNVTDDDDVDNTNMPIPRDSPFSADVAREMILRKCGLDVPAVYYQYPLTDEDTYQQQVQDYLGALAFVADVHRGRLRVKTGDNLERERRVEMERRSHQGDRQYFNELQQQHRGQKQQGGGGGFWGDNDVQLYVSDVDSDNGSSVSHFMGMKGGGGHEDIVFVDSGEFNNNNDSTTHHHHSPTTTAGAHYQRLMREIQINHPLNRGDAAGINHHHHH